MTRVATSGKEAGKGKGEARRWPSNPKRNKFSLD
jgi:hypothetical protein